MTSVIKRYIITAPKMFPFELVQNILIFEGEHELVKGEVVRRVRKIAKDDNRFTIIGRLEMPFSYSLYNKEWCIYVKLLFKMDHDGDLYYHLQNNISNDGRIEKYVDILWEYRRSYDSVRIESHKIINDEPVLCVKPSGREDYTEYQYY
jgi:hypothetical protein